MALFIFSVGEDGSDPLVIVAKDYFKRTNRVLSPQFQAVKESKRKSKGQIAKAEDDEATMLLEKSAGCFRIALDEKGEQLDSMTFSKMLNRYLVAGRPIAFLIGGASGLSERVLNASDKTWSLSAMTMPHRLALLVLSEQIYRAGEIFKNSPYHKL